MALSNADKQKWHRERLQNQGLIHVQGWVSPAQAELIKQIIAGASEASEGANEIIDGIKNIKERWGTVLEKHRDPINGRISQPRWTKCFELWQQLARALDKNIIYGIRDQKNDEREGLIVIRRPPAITDSSADLRDSS
jgi:hypothetical protein